jgi:hypothetical protein
MTDFNRGSGDFTRVDNMGSLQPKTNYLIRYRRMGEPRMDYIATFYSPKPNTFDLKLNFNILYERPARYSDGDPYAKWTKKSNSNYIKFTDWDLFGENPDVTIYGLGEHGNLITREKSPDKVTEEVTEEVMEEIRKQQRLEQKSAHYLAKPNGNRPGLNPDVLNIVKSYLGPMKVDLGGKTKRKRRRNRTNKKKKPSTRKR